MTLFDILHNLIDGYNKYDIADRIGSQANEYDLEVAEEMIKLTAEDTEEKIVVALSNLLDGETAHDLVGWTGDSLESCQMQIDTYNKAYQRLKMVA